MPAGHQSCGFSMARSTLALPCSRSARLRATGCFAKEDLDVRSKTIAPGRADRHVNIQRDRAFLGMVLQDGHIIEPGHVERFDPDIPPDATGDQRGPPVPAEIARFLPHVAGPG